MFHRKSGEFKRRDRRPLVSCWSRFSIIIGMLANKIQPREKSRSSEYRWQKAITYGSVYSLNVCWNADGLNVDNNWNRDNANYNVGAVPRWSPPKLFLFKRPHPSTQHSACFLQFFLQQEIFFSVNSFYLFSQSHQGF
ncbi:MAG: hypothetical protein CEN92_102 [Candidatus Berkelbacteria bacterium Licking1014_96]|uniref:Uncharacterized protein n=1 Tax=Candidatus Berkelbacteria bacterium Licking1014_96 TaxID=2017149 RepID=A0A554LH04_9BACT|nr:MAG: hypothetical protein CEN92_102 [Candidatus Berkelbacteria bacterium Licking1014_96]